MKNEENLAGRLLYLPLDLNEKVLLWLAYHGSKPVSDVYVSRRGNSLALIRRGIKPVFTYDYNSTRSNRIKKWIRDAGLFFELEDEDNSSWCVGRNPNDVKELARILHKFDYKNEYRTGILFGFPEESSKAYAQNRVSVEAYQIPMVGTGHLIYEDLFLKDKYYAPYVFYNMPKSRVVEDSKIAKEWADIIRKDIPVLAKWFEKNEAKKRQKGLARR